MKNGCGNSDLNQRTGKNAKETYAELISRDVLPCIKCGSEDTDFWYRKTNHIDIDERWQCGYECRGRNHVHTFSECCNEPIGYGRTLKVAISRAKKAWNTMNKPGRKRKFIKENK